MKIITAELQHLSEVATLFDQYRIFYGLDSNLRESRNFIESRMKNNESVIFLALDGKEALGFVQLYPSFSSLAMKRQWILNDLFVHPEHRHKKVASKLLEASEEHARQTQSKGLTLMTASDNLAAQKLYLAREWKQVTKFLTFSKTF